MTHQDPQAILDNLPVAYLETDVHGLILHANRLRRALHPPEIGDIVGKFLWELEPAGERDASRAAFLLAMQAGGTMPIIRRSVYNSDGRFHTLEIHRSFVLNAEGKVAGMRSMTIDVTEAERAHQIAHQAREWLENVVDSVIEAVIVTDALGYVRTVNPAAEKLFGYPAAELAGRPIEKGLPILCFADSNSTPLNFSMTLDKSTRAIATMLNHERKPMKVEISTSPIIDKEHGYTVGVVSIWRELDAA
jgi:PAS domain S-box-containing protein